MSLKRWFQTELAVNCCLQTKPLFPGGGGLQERKESDMPNHPEPNSLSLSLSLLHTKRKRKQPSRLQKTYMQLRVWHEPEARHERGVLVGGLDGDDVAPGGPVGHALRRGRDARHRLELGAQLADGPRRRDAPLGRRVVRDDEEWDVGHFDLRCACV